MAGAVVQVKTAVANTNTTPASITLDAPATAGNILVVSFGGDDYVASGNRPSGFSEPTGGRQETFLGHYVWYKVAAGGETSISATPGSAVPWCMIAMELSGVGALDISNGTFTASGANTVATPTLTPTVGDRFVVAVIGGSLNANFNTGVGAWTNGFVEAADVATTLASGTRDNIAAATVGITATGSSTIDTTATWDNAISPQSRTAIILAFTVAAAGTSASAGLATGAGSADNPTVSAPGSATPAAAAATGSALGPLVSISSAPTEATAAGVALWDSGSSISLDLTADNPVVGVGVAFDAVISTSSSVSPAPAEAIGAGTAGAPVVSAGAPTAEAIGSGAAAGPSPAITANATEATAAGVAGDPTVSTSSAVNVGAVEAVGSGSALSPTVSTVSQVSADAGLASASGLAVDPSTAAQVLASAAAAVAAAQDAIAQAGADGAVLAGLASGAGEACSPRRLARMTPRPFAGITYRP